MAGARTLNWLGVSVYVGFRVFLTLLMILVPAAGVWVASSIAAYLNGPVWLVCLAGLLLFPGLPLAWEAVSKLRRRGRRKRSDQPVLTAWDRLILRTIVLNAIFLTVLLWRAPHTAFEATSTRGDWMLDGIEHPTAQRVRSGLLWTADGLQWLYASANHNEFAEMIEADARPADRPEIPIASEDAWADPWARADEEPVPDETADSSEPRDPRRWPFLAEVHPVVAQMPDDVKTSIERVGRYIAEHESDPYLRVKAIHDFVAVHVAYDAPSYLAGTYPPQDAGSVFETRLSVCAGYANLTKAIADVTQDEVVVVVGDARTRGSDLSGEGHAWNAVRIEGLWYLLDTTWDSGHLEGGRFVPNYRTSYFLPPPAVMGITHFPEDPMWQLRAEPIGQGEFLRQPMMQPDFFAEGFTLEEPRRSQITVDREIELRLGNARSRHVLATFEVGRGERGGDCQVTPGRRVAVHCELPSAGTYQIKLFWSPERYGTYAFLGELEAHARG